MWNNVETICACAHCGKQCERRVCRQCHLTSYCNSKCQRADWPKHKTTCSTLAKNNSPEETRVFAQSKRFMMLVDTVYYDGRRDQPNFYREHLEHIVAAYLELADGHYAMGVAPVVEINWGLVPMNNCHVLQVMDVQVRHMKSEEHPLAQKMPYVRLLMDIALAKLHTIIDDLNEQEVDNHEPHSGCVVPILNLSRGFTGHFSEITMLSMPFVTKHAKMMWQELEDYFSPEVTQAPDFIYNMVGLLNGFLANDKRYRFRTTRLPSFSTAEKERIQAGQTSHGRALTLKVVLSESEAWS